MIPSLPFATINEFMAFAVVFGRMAGIFSSIPSFGGRAVPVRIKTVAVLAMTLLLFPLVRTRVPPLDGDAIGLMILMVREALIGFTLGLLAQVIFSGIEFCGQLVATQMGLSIAVQFDPAMEGQFTAMAVLQNLLAMLLFLSLGVHHFFFSALVDSYQTLPVGSWQVKEELVLFIIGLVGQIFVIGIKLAAPVMVSLLATTVVLGVMARAFPQMNIFVVSLPLNIGIGFMVLGFTVLAFLKTLQGTFGQLPLQLKTIFKLLS